jgi:hypothetical protein
MSSAILTVDSNEIKIKTENNQIISYNYKMQNIIEVTFNLQDLIKDQIITEYGEFMLFDIPNSGFIGNQGKPILPVVTRYIAVPTLDISLDIINIQNHIMDSVGKIYPAQKPQTDSELAEVEFIIDEIFYQQDIQYPGKLVEIVTDGNIRDISFVKLKFYPIQYNPKQEIATIYDKITVELTWNSVEMVMVESDFSHSSFYKTYANTFSNWEGFLENTNIEEQTKSSGNGGRQEGCDYIIITHPDYYSQIEPLANWKHSKGYKTHLVDTTVTGTTSSAIKQYIQDAYDDWSPKPSYLLIVGDAEDVPTSSSGTDLFYVTVDGSDYFPDMFHGRIPIDTTQELETIVNKIINYEQNPPSLASFYENFAVAAYFQDDENNGYETRRFVRTSEEIRDYLMTEDYIGERIYCTESYINPTHYNNGYYGNGEPLPSELRRPTFPWDGDADDIINAIENGIFILNHRDHGGNDGWGDPYFVSSHITGLTNGNLLPVVFSINCLTGRFDGSSECFAENFIRKDGGGAVAVFAATRVSYSGYNDYLCRGFYDAQWPDFDPDYGIDDPMYTLGEILNNGKVYMTETWGDPWGYEDYTFELFHVFGDPTMEIWTEVPKDLDVTYAFAGDYLEVTVEGPTGPINGALVCISQESGFYGKGITDHSGKVSIDTTGAVALEEMSIVASYHNHLPYENTFFLNQAPEAPAMPNGPTSGKPNQELTFTADTTDPDDDQIWYMWRWGDGSYSDWIGPYNSGDSVEGSHSWSDTSNYQVRVRAKDSMDQETDWSEPLLVSIQKSKLMNTWFLNLLERVPNSFPIIRTILGL